MADTDPAAAPPVAPVAIFKKRGAKGQANLRKRPATPPPPAKDSDDDDDSDFSSSEDEAGQRIKRRKKNPTKSSAVVAASSRSTVKDDGVISRETIFKADRNRDLGASNDATKQSNWFDEGQDDLSAKNLLGSVVRKGKQVKKGIENAPEEDGLYRGLANQKSYIQKNPDAPSRTVGPVKAPTNIRTITITDMAPDVCKDYRLTGFCGFGDNCKFAHVREDYAHGWQLDKAWEDVTKGKKVIAGTVVSNVDNRKKKGGGGGGGGADDDDKDAQEEEMLGNIPFACIICQGPYKSPVMTRCGHYFCEGCALKRYRRDPGCAACGSGTNGVFNAAKKLNKLLEKKKERAAKRRQKAIENGEEVSDEEEEEEDEGGGGAEDDD